MTDVAVVYQFFVPKVKVNILEVPFTHFPISGADNLTQPEADNFDKFRNRLDAAASYAEVWQIVKETVDFAFGKHRGSMMLFLDDMPLQVGAYHPVGTNNIVLNRRLVDIVEAALSSKRLVNALVYNLLLHEYLHALGELSEVEVRRQVVDVTKKCFGEEHAATVLAKKSPWILLRNIPLEAANSPKRVMQIVRDFEKTDKYIV
jgi:hypothetical protein